MDSNNPTANVAATPQPAPPPSPVAPPPSPQATVQNMDAGESKPNRLKLIIIIVVVLLLLLIAGGGAYYFLVLRAAKPTASTGQTAFSQTIQSLDALQNDLNAVPAQDDTNTEFTQVDQDLQTL